MGAKTKVRHERRQAVRCACQIPVSCQPAIPAESAPWETISRDVSATGIGMILPRRPEQGDLLEVRMYNSARTFECSRLVLVIHAYAQTDNTWVVGGNFYSDLKFDELKLLS